MSQPMADAPVTESERLSFSVFAPDDAALLAGLHSDPEGERYLFRDGMVWSEAYATSEIAKWRQTFADKGYSKFKLTRNSDGAFLGRAGFGFEETHGVAELGYTIIRAEWGKGYATEAAARLARWFFEEDLDDRFIAFAVPENTASVAVLRKIGMREIAPLTIKGIVCTSFEMVAAR
ncbi:GNAT family N-acetyltransferase [Martelella lutilitoris]|uniref:GNAT family N-acetyltransferase n=1 Tax=Martelella lutilitoris TaxID=2583532 RepID=A0A5C4JQD0_9HYPH|nr:GNAT family N-acetyltransferase [Martelella lutilitoris]TNB46869.1 GNAT family N-acetyltransferase [Martelella lutilitoris]